MSLLGLLFIAAASFVSGLCFALGAMLGVVVAMTLSDFRDYWDR